MIRTLAALLILSSAALAQDPPPVPRPERRDPLQPQPGRPPEGPRPVQPPATPEPPGGHAQPFNAEEVREWLRVNEPETHRRLMQMQGDGRRPEAMRILNEAAPRMRELSELKMRDPNAYAKLMDLRRLERESMEQAEAVRRASPEQRETAMAVLKETLNKLFDVREEARARELAELKRRVEALEKSVKERHGAKDRIVEKRRRELLGEKSEDDW